MHRSVPNILTLFRIAAAPVLWYFIVKGEVSWALAFLTAAVISDFYDGKVARKYSLTSKAGSFLDPLADKVLVLSAFTAFYMCKVIPLWIVLVIAGRDLVVTILRSALLSFGYELQTSWFAKSKTVVQFFAIYLMLLGGFLLFGPTGTGGVAAKIVINRTLYYIGVGTAILTVASGLDYLRCIRPRKKTNDDTVVHKA